MACACSHRTASVPRMQLRFAVCAARHRKAVPSEVEKSVKRRLMKRPIVLSTHAVERLEQRYVTEENIMEALRNGKIDKTRSKFGGSLSPVFTLEAAVGTPPRPLRVILAQKPEATVVMTVMFTDNNDSQDAPGPQQCEHNSST